MSSSRSGGEIAHFRIHALVLDVGVHREDLDDLVDDATFFHAGRSAVTVSRWGAGVPLGNRHSSSYPPRKALHDSTGASPTTRTPFRLDALIVGAVFLGVAMVALGFLLSRHAAATASRAGTL